MAETMAIALAPVAIEKSVDAMSWVTLESESSSWSGMKEAM